MNQSINQSIRRGRGVWSRVRVRQRYILRRALVGFLINKAVRSQASLIWRCPAMQIMTPTLLFVYAGGSPLAFGNWCSPRSLCRFESPTLRTLLTFHDKLERPCHRGACMRRAGMAASSVKGGESRWAHLLMLVVVFILINPPQLLH